MSDEAGAAADPRWRQDETARITEESAVKPVPSCPSCGAEMSKTGTLNRGEHTPVRVFQCMAYECPNKRRYNRHGQEIW